MPTKAMQGEHKYGITPPYISFLTFQNFLDWIKGMPVTPTQIDRSLWEPKFSGSTGGQLIVGVRFLKLLDGDNKPTGLLDKLARADNETRTGEMLQMLQGAYGDEVIEVLRTGTPKMVEEKLETLGTTESTKRKAASFLVNAAKFAKVEIQPSIAKKARNRPTGFKKHSPQPKTGTGSEGGNGDPSKTKKGAISPPTNTETVTLNAGTVSVSLVLNWIALTEDERKDVLAFIDAFKVLQARSQ